MDDSLTQLTPEKAERTPEPWMERFLALLSEFGNVSAACAGAGISRFTAYKYRHADPYFAQQWQAAADLGLDGLEDMARARASTISDTLMIFLLKAGRPEKYRERIEQRQLSTTPEQAKAMSDEELEAALKAKGLL
jgi:hypothetical protein